MSYELFKFGSVYLDESELPVPETPKTGGDIPQLCGKGIISIRDSDALGPITWIKPEGMDLLIADRVLLTNVSWSWLDKNGFIKGKVMHLNGLDLTCRLPQVGDEHEYSEWDQCLDRSGSDDDNLWHWNKMKFWGRDVIAGRYQFRATRGYGSPVERIKYTASTEGKHIGFRPVLELHVPEFLPMEWNVCLEGQPFTVSAMKRGKRSAKIVGLRPALLPKPVADARDSSVFGGVAFLSRVKAYTLLMDGLPVRQDLDKPVRYKAGATLVLTDKYLGEEYLIPWVITQTGAYAEREILRDIKVEDLQGQTFA